MPRAVPTRGVLGGFVRRGGSVTIIMSRFKKASNVMALRSLMRRVFNSVRSRRSGAACMTGQLGGGRFILSNELRMRGTGRLLGVGLPRSRSCIAMDKLVLRRCRDFPGLGRIIGFSGCRFGVVGGAAAGVRLIHLGVAR